MGPHRSNLPPISSSPTDIEQSKRRCLLKGWSWKPPLTSHRNPHEQKKTHSHTSRRTQYTDRQPANTLWPSCPTKPHSDNKTPPCPPTGQTPCLVAARPTHSLETPRNPMISRTRNNHRRANLCRHHTTAMPYNSHPTIVTVDATVAYCPSAQAYPAQRGQRSKLIAA